MLNRGYLAASVVLCSVVIGATAASAQDRSFVAEGSDTTLGLGARQLAMGGTGASHATGPYALHYNPALLADLEGVSLTLGRQADATLRPYSFLGVAMPLPVGDDLGLRVGVAAARYPRIHTRSTGAFSEADPESVFLRFLLPGIAGTYDGDIDSKTMVNTFGVGIGPAQGDAWSLGVAANWIDCKTESCGVHAGSDGVEVASAHARALSFSLGGTVRLTDRITLAGAVSDLRAVLNVDTIRTDDAGTTELTYTAQIPARLQFEAAFQMRDDLLIAAGVQSYFGEYGDDPIRIVTGHVGAEWAFSDAWRARAGALVPLTIETGQSTALDVPVPFAPTLGLGWQGDHIALDAALFAHPIMTFHDDAPAITAELGLSFRF